MSHGDTQKLLCEPLLSDTVVDDAGLARYLRAIVRVRQLAGEVQTEVGIPLNLLVSELDDLQSPDDMVHQHHKKLPIEALPEFHIATLTATGMCV